MVNGKNALRSYTLEGNVITANLIESIASGNQIEFTLIGKNSYITKKTIFYSVAEKMPDTD
jgi:hypothetical protein